MSLINIFVKYRNIQKPVLKNSGSFADSIEKLRNKDIEIVSHDALLNDFHLYKLANKVNIDHAENKTLTE